MFSTDFGLGTLIGNLSSAYGSGRLAQQRAKRRQLDWMDDEMIARVEASKAAGIHPLVGLGVSGLGSMPQVSSPAPRFQYQSDARVDPDTARLRRAQADLAEIQVEAAANRLAGQPGNLPSRDFMSSWDSDDRLVRSVQAPGPYQFQPGAEGKIPGYADVAQIKPSESQSRSSAFPFLTASGDPAMREYTIPVGGKPMRVMLPYSQEGVSETLENVKLGMWPFIWKENVRHYGRDWADEVWDAIGLPRFNRRYRVGPDTRGAREFTGSSNMPGE